MNTNELKKALKVGKFDDILKKLYFDKCSERKERLLGAIDSFTAIYGEKDDVMLLSVPGRSEISGNHTDHNNGKVVAASVDCDIIAVAAKGKENSVRIKSEGYPGDVIDLAKMNPGDYPYYKSAALVCGMAKAFKNAGYNVSGIDAYTTSNVLKGSGLSSSAAFEVMVGNILNHVCNAGSVKNEEIAMMAQWAENNYFGKPCGLMDQMACAVGGFINIDFKNPSKPLVRKIDFSLNEYGYELCIVDTGGSHSDLNEDYASIPREMKAVAGFFSKETLRDVNEKELLENASSIRKKLGDRALLRAIHYLNENNRVDKIASAMEKGDIKTFIETVEESGISSLGCLQNVFSPAHPSEQGISLALAVSKEIFKQYKGDKKPVCRVHGGGFAGTMQAFVPEEFAGVYKKETESVFGKNNCMIMNIRQLGAVRIG